MRKVQQSQQTNNGILPKSKIKNKVKYQEKPQMIEPGICLMYVYIDGDYECYKKIFLN